MLLWLLQMLKMLKRSPCVFFPHRSTYLIGFSMLGLIGCTSTRKLNIPRSVLTCAWEWSASMLTSKVECPCPKNLFRIFLSLICKQYQRIVCHSIKPSQACLIFYEDKQPCVSAHFLVWNIGVKMCLVSHVTDQAQLSPHGCFKENWRFT